MAKLTKEAFTQLAFEFSDWVFDNLPDRVSVGYIAGRSRSPLVILLPEVVDMDAINDYFEERTGHNFEYWEKLDYFVTTTSGSAIVCENCGKIIEVDMDGNVDCWEDADGMVCVECISEDSQIRRAYLDDYINEPEKFSVLLLRAGFEAEGFQKFFVGTRNTFDAGQIDPQDVIETAELAGWNQWVLSTENPDASGVNFHLYVR